jgi:hypothetical protein
VHPDSVILMMKMKIRLRTQSKCKHYFILRRRFTIVTDFVRLNRVVQILEMYPDKSPEMILQIFNDCDGRKDVVIETLMTAENYIQGPP